jgi:hypothetical protein
MRPKDRNGYGQQHNMAQAVWISQLRGCQVETAGLFITEMTEDNQ